MSAPILSDECNSVLSHDLLLKESVEKYVSDIVSRCCRMSARVLPEDNSALSYGLLLKKSVEQCSEQPATADAASLEAASTAEPDTPCSGSVIESVASAMPEKANTVVLRNVAHAGPHADIRMENLIQQIRDLSQLVFDEDCLKEVTKKSKWKLSLLATKDLSTLCGYAITRITNGALSIAKIAVPIEFRGLGFGKLLMEDAIKIAKKDTCVYEVGLSSLATAVTFYQRIGFKALTGVKVKTDFEVVEGQVYMVKKLRPRPKGK